MIRRSVFWLAVLMAVVVAVGAWANSDPRVVGPRQAPTPVWGGAQEPTQFQAGPVALPPRHNALDEPLGTRYEAGNTYYEYQHNGTTGKMVGADDFGYVHIVWMKGLTNVATGPRHIYYNIWDPATEAFLLLPDGNQVNSGSRGGYASMTLLPSGAAGGWVFPSFHQSMSDDNNNPHTAAGLDYAPGTGAFTVTRPNYVRDDQGRAIQAIWPKIAIGRDSTLHVVCTESPIGGAAGDPQKMYYCRGIPTWEDGLGLQIDWQTVDRVNGQDVQYKQIDVVMTIAGDIAASPVSDRVVIGWAHPKDDVNGAASNQIDNDFMILISEDGGLNWGEPQNITNFIPPDESCPGGDSAVCNRDTFRLYTDCNVIFDGNDFIHGSFCTHTMYRFLDGDSGSFYQYYGRSGVWHWGEQYNEISPIDGFWETMYNADSTAVINPGAWQRYVQRPNLSWDDSTGYLYCAYQFYMPGQWSDQMYPMGDIFVSASCNGGRAWGQGVNVTRSDGGQDTPPPNSLSDRDPTVATNVTYDADGGYVHLSYVEDHDAGGSTQAEGTIVLCPVYYQRIPVDSIPLHPVYNPWWPAIHADSTQIPGHTVPLDTTGAELCGTPVRTPRSNETPASFNLFQNYPNPFNPSTEIQFDLVRDAKVTLTVFNVLGQQVAQLYNGQNLAAGAHTVSFDGANLPSGVYMYRLEADGFAATRKMILMK